MANLTIPVRRMYGQDRSLLQKTKTGKVKKKKYKNLNEYHSFIITNPLIKTMPSNQKHSSEDYYCIVKGL
jgi:hypothetical protein